MSSKATDLEARIAELDERLRLARGEVTTNSSTETSGPQAQLSVQRHSQGGVVLSPKSPIAVAPTSPWRDVARRALTADDEEMNRMVERQKVVHQAIEGRILDTHSKLRATNVQASQMEEDILRARRHKDIAEAASARALDDAERRLIAVEREHSGLNQQLHELQSQKELLTKQLEDVRAASRRAELRLVELTKDSEAVSSRHRELATALNEQQKRSQDSSSVFDNIKRRLEQRISELTEENKFHSERLKKMEAQFAVQQSSWIESEASLGAEVQVAIAQAEEIKMRFEAAEQELHEREREAELQRKLRERRFEELIQSRAVERAREADRNAKETAAREVAVRKEREAVHALLRQQLEDLHIQIERKRRVRDVQAESVAELKRQLAQLQLSVDEKMSLNTECSELQDEIASHERAVTSLRADEQELRTAIEKTQEEIAVLRLQAKTLKDKLDEESRLKQLLAETSKELLEAERRHEEEVTSVALQEKEIADEQMALQSTLNSAQADIAATHQDASIELDSLSRRIAAVRQEVADKEAELNRLVSENALKQTTIAQYEEERRRLEREQSNRKASAAQAARAALSELAM